MRRAHQEPRNWRARLQFIGYVCVPIRIKAVILQLIVLGKKKITEWFINVESSSASLR